MKYKVVSIGELGKVVTGKTPPTNNPIFYNGIFPFYTPSDLDGRRIIDSTKRTLTKEGISHVIQSIIEKGSIMVSCIGSDMGKVAIAPVSGVTNQQINTITPYQGIDHLYVYYVLSKLKKKLQSLATGGSAQPILKKSHFCRIKIEIPPISTQKAISHILNTLDKKIELNKETNNNLEQIIKTIFKSWFIDFDPVKAKREAKSIGFSSEINKFFPSSFEDSELGMIPNGWSICPIEDLISLEKYSVDPSKQSEEQFIHYSIPAFDKGLSPSEEFGKNIKSNKYLIKDGIFLTSKLNPYKSRVWLPSPNRLTKRICSTEFLVCRPADLVGIPFGYCLAKSNFIHQKMCNLAGGTSNSHQRIRASDFTSIKVIRPTDEILNLFNEQISVFLKKILLVRDQNIILRRCRDSLLPKLISGKIKVDDAEKILTDLNI